MRSWVRLASTLVLVLCLFSAQGMAPPGGCEREPDYPLFSPTDLRIQVSGSKSHALLLTWDPSEQTVDGYIVAFRGNEIARTSSCFCEHTPASLGTYSVRAYRGKEKSNRIYASSTLYERADEGPIYWMHDTLPDHRSGYGWNPTGKGSAFTVEPAARYFIDLVLDPAEDLRSPADTFGATWHTTQIAYDSSWMYQQVAVAPEYGYGSRESVVEDGSYVLRLESGYYLKLEITRYDVPSHSIRFRYGMQLIRGFRRLGE